MQLQNFYAQDVNGNIVPGAVCTLYLAGTMTLATGLQDVNGNPLGNPFSANSIGLAAVAAPQGLYDFEMVRGLINNKIRVEFIDSAQVAADAATAAAAAATAVTLTDRFLAPSATAPTTRDNGSPLQIGDTYLNTTTQTQNVYKSTGWAAYIDAQKLALPTAAAGVGAVLTDGTNGSVQDLITQAASTSNPLQGAAIIGRATVSVASIGDLLAQKKESNLLFLMRQFKLGTGIGGGSWIWDPSAPRSQHNGFLTVSPTVPFNGTDAGILPFLQGAGDTAPGASGCFRRVFAGKVLTSWAGARPGIDSYQIVQFVIDKLLLQNLPVHAQGSHTFSAGVVMPTYRTPAAPIYKDWNRVSVEIDEILYTGTSGVAVTALSPLAKLILHRAIGPGADAGTTTCVESGGVGDPMHQIGYVSGFTDALHLNHAFGHSIDIGWLTNGIRGIRGDDSNACKIYKGRIGGGFSSSAIDPESLEVGVVWGPDCSENHVYSNVEYCRRSSTATGVSDFGAANGFHGYIESCAAFGLLATGKDSNNRLIAGGTNVVGEASTLYASDLTTIALTTPFDYNNETPGVDGNTDLTFLLLQGIGFGNSGNLNAPRGLQSFQRRTNTYRNELLDSNDLGTASWNNTVFGSALWSNVTLSASTVFMPEWGIPAATRMSFPAVADTASFYAKSQTITLAQGPVSYGIFAYCESGEVEVFVRVLGGGKQSRQQYKLIPSSGFIRLQSRITNNQATDTGGTYQIQFRSRIGGVIHIAGAHSINFPDVNIPVTNGAERTKVIPGAEVNGTTFYNGMNLNGRFKVGANVLSGASTVVLSNAVRGYSRYEVGALNANIQLNAWEDGDELLIVRNGAISTGCSLIGLSVAISGQASYSLTLPYSGIHLWYSANAGEWLVIAVIKPPPY